ncbi:hypothetical protein GCM10017750_07800 [Streptomyces racemochromogenes]
MAPSLGLRRPRGSASRRRPDPLAELRPMNGACLRESQQDAIFLHSSWVSKPHKDAFTPFSAGHRRCVGDG